MSGRLKIGSLFSGYGGLDLAAEAFFDADTAWHVEFDDAPSRILDARWPGVPNHGDITTVDWSQVEPVDILTGGFPCQDLSLAGRRAGMRPGTRSGLWADFVNAIRALNPSVVVIENVRGLLSGCAESDLGSCPGCVDDGEHRPLLRALGRVLGDLADLGFDAEWAGIRASDVGAPHGRFRVFVVAYSRRVLSSGRFAVAGEASRGRASAESAGRDRALVKLLQTPTAQDANSSGGSVPSNVTLTDAVTGRRGLLMPTHRATRGGSSTELMYGLGAERSDEGDAQGIVTLADAILDWGQYEPAVRRWEALTRPAPSPTLPDGKNGQHRLNAAFAEWMMGLDEGWVTGPAIGLTRREQLKACGNGVVPQQAYVALEGLWPRVLEAVEA